MHAVAGGDLDYDIFMFGDARTDYASALPQKKEGAGRWVSQPTGGVVTAGASVCGL